MGHVAIVARINRLVKLEEPAGKQPKLRPRL